MCVATYVFVSKRRIRAFPSRYATATVAEREETGLDPRCAETIKKISLACNLILVEIGVAKLANVYLSDVHKQSFFTSMCPNCLLCLGRNRIRRSRSRYWHSSLKQQGMVR